MKNNSSASDRIVALLFFFLSEDESDAEAEFDLGTKIKTPKDVMLEELSLLKNKGSKMFRMRQQRVEKFIVTNENMVRARNGNTVLVLSVHVCSHQIIPSVFIFQQNLQNLLMSPPPVPPKPELPKEECRTTGIVFKKFQVCIFIFYLCNFCVF